MIRIEHQGPRLDVILSDPERLNAQTAATWRSLAAIGAEPPAGVRVIVLRAEGRSFSAGLDKKVFAGEAEPNLASMAKLSESEFDHAVAEFQKGFTVWRQSDAIVIAAVRGHAIGAGFQLALGADIRLLSETAQLCMREPALGMVPDLAGTEPLLDIVGYSRALEICITGRMVGARESMELGLATLVVPDGELESATDDLIAAILAAPETSIRATKKLLARARNRDRDEQRALERQLQSSLLRGMK